MSVHTRSRGDYERTWEHEHYAVQVAHDTAIRRDTIDLQGSGYYHGHSATRRWVWKRYRVSIPLMTDADPRGDSLLTLYRAWEAVEHVEAIAATFWDCPENVFRLSAALRGKARAKDGTLVYATRPAHEQVERITCITKDGYTIVQWQHHDPVEGRLTMQATMQLEPLT